jgi:hypothetical protein
MRFASASVAPVLCLALLLATVPCFAQALDVPMDRGLRTILIVFGVKATTPATWEGSYELSGGRIVATDGWRFAGDDFATVDRFRVENRRWFPLLWSQQNRDPNTLPVEPNGLMLTLTGVTGASRLTVKTGAGEFEVPVGSMGMGGVQRALDGNVEFQRVPTSRQFLRAPTEDGYPAAAATADGLCVAYVAFTHGEGFRSRPPIREMPKEYGFLATPVGGDQLMYTEMKGGQWAPPVALTDPGQDLFMPAIAVDGAGRPWVFWSANNNENWDLWARVRTGDSWSAPQRVTSQPGSDFGVVSATDPTGRVWVAWQALTGQSSDILVARQEDDAMGRPQAVANGPADEWSPTIATSADGEVAVVWDTYERGSYDVVARRWRGDQWGEPRVIAGTVRNEARPSAAYDRQGRVWIAYEVSSEGWGKNFGPYDQSPTRTALYQSREVEVRVLEGNNLLAPEADVNLALPMPEGKARGPQAQRRCLASGPRIAVAADGRVWLSSRQRMSRFESPVGMGWVSFLTTLEGNRWRQAVIVPGTDGYLHDAPALIPAPNAGLYVVSTSDGRMRAAPFVGPQLQALRRRPPDAPPATTRSYVTYPDWQFNQELAIADTGVISPVQEQPVLVAASDEVAPPTDLTLAERAQIAAERDYRAEVGGQSLRIWRGEFHRHTEFSGDGGGDGSIFDMWRYALNMASLDWVGNGDHDNGAREFPWWMTQKTTSLFAMPGRFTPMFTYERSVNYPDGHRNVVFAQRGVRPLPRLQGGTGQVMDDQPAAERPHSPDTQMLYQYLKAFDGVCASHTSGTDMGTDWRDNDAQVEPLVEIYQGDRQNYERAGAPRTMTAEYTIGGYRPLGFISNALLKGYRLGFQCSSDHISTHMSYCNVWVDRPGRDAILDAMKKRRVYGATDNIIADVRCGEHFMGEEFTVTEPPRIHVKLIGTAAFDNVTIVKDNEYVYTIEPKTQTVEFDWMDNNVTPGKTSYYYVRGTQVGDTTERTVKGADGSNVTVQLNNGELVWASPMWIKYQP